MQELDLKTHTEQALMLFMTTKHVTCRRNGEPTDLMQQLDVETDTMRGVALVPDRRYIVAAVRDLESDFGKAIRIVHLGDSYGLEQHPSEPQPTMLPADAFAAGKPNAYECLVASGIDCRSGEVVFLSVKYVYVDNLPEFNDIMQNQEGSGHVLDELKAAASAQ